MTVIETIKNETYRAEKKGLKKKERKKKYQLTVVQPKAP